MQVARSAEAVRQLAHHLHADEPLVEERCDGPGLREAAAGEQIVRIKIEAIALDSTSVKVHPDATGALKNGPQAIGKSRGVWNTKIHLVAADARTAITFALSPGHAHDAPEGRELLRELGAMPEGLPLLMDRAYEGNETRQLVLALGMVPVVPPKSNRVDPWRYDRALYRKRNEIERLFRRMKGYRHIFSRFEKLDVLFLAFAFIVEALR
jgi:transposase